MKVKINIDIVVEDNNGNHIIQWCNTDADKECNTIYGAMGMIDGTLSTCKDAIKQQKYKHIEDTGESFLSFFGEKACKEEAESLDRAIIEHLKEHLGEDHERKEHLKQHTEE